MSFSRQLQNQDLDEILAAIRKGEQPQPKDGDKETQLDSGIVIQPLPQATMLDVNVETLVQIPTEIIVDSNETQNDA